MYLTRHSDMISGIKLDTNITVAGAGSIGSYATLALAKLGFNNITVFDDAVVEEENIAPQFFKLKDIGKRKVDALKRSVFELTGVSIIAVPSKLEGVMLPNMHMSMLVCAVDSMTARKDIAYNGSYDSFVDARMAIEFLTVIAYRNEYRQYKNTLFSDEQAVQEACTNKAISYTSLIAGGLVAKSVLDLLKCSDDYYYRTVNLDINNFDMLKL